MRYFNSEIIQPQIKLEEFNFSRMPLPETDAELEVITYIYFGKALHLSKLLINSYEVKELYNSYHGKGYQFSENDCTGYDHSGVFWNRILGKRYCGGIAGQSYGQFNYRELGYRHQKRLDKWIRNRRNEINYLRKPFKRLAGIVGFPERTE